LTKPLDKTGGAHAIFWWWRLFYHDNGISFSQLFARVWTERLAARMGLAGGGGSGILPACAADGARLSKFACWGEVWTFGSERVCHDASTDGAFLVWVGLCYLHDLSDYLTDRYRCLGAIEQFG